MAPTTGIRLATKLPLFGIASLGALLGGTTVKFSGNHYLAGHIENDCIDIMMIMQSCGSMSNVTSSTITSASHGVATVHAFKMIEEQNQEQNEQQDQVDEIPDQQNQVQNQIPNSDSNSRSPQLPELPLSDLRD